MSFVDAHDFLVGLVLRVLGVPESTYHDRRPRQAVPSRRQLEDAVLLEHILRAADEFAATYGSPRVWLRAPQGVPRRWPRPSTPRASWPADTAVEPFHLAGDPRSACAAKPPGWRPPRAGQQWAQPADVPVPRRAPAGERRALPLGRRAHAVPPAHDRLGRRRSAEGKTKPEIIRCLKRYLAREIWAHLHPERHQHADPIAA